MDLENDRVRLGTGKGSGETDERELPIIPLLASMLQKLTKGKNQDLIFHQQHGPNKPLSYHRAEKVMARVKTQMKAEKGIICDGSNRSILMI